MTVYVDPNFSSKKDFKEAVEAGKRCDLFLPGLGSIPDNGTTVVSGPHYPKPHKWYATVTIENGKVVKVK